MNAAQSVASRLLEDEEFDHKEYAMSSPRFEFRHTSYDGLAVYNVDEIEAEADSRNAWSQPICNLIGIHGKWFILKAVNIPVNEWQLKAFDTKESAALWVWQTIPRFPREDNIIKRHMVQRDSWPSNAQMVQLTGKP